MEEKKKRFRPTLTAYREQEARIACLENDIENRRDENERLLAECRKFRDEVKRLKARTLWQRIING